MWTGASLINPKRMRSEHITCRAHSLLTRETRGHRMFAHVGSRIHQRDQQTGRQRRHGPPPPGTRCRGHQPSGAKCSYGRAARHETPATPLGKTCFSPPSGRDSDWRAADPALNRQPRGLVRTSISLSITNRRHPLGRPHQVLQGRVLPASERRAVKPLSPPWAPRLLRSRTLVHSGLLGKPVCRMLLSSPLGQ